jgi:hypothetical protein
MQNKETRQSLWNYFTFIFNQKLLILKKVLNFKLIYILYLELFPYA